MQHVLVTGATGFIGARLVEQLTGRKVKVTCLVRETSNRAAVSRWNPDFVIGDLTHSSDVAKAIGEVDTVINLAGTTKAFHPAGFRPANIDAPRTIAECCARRTTPPVLVHVSSLAAAGPSAVGKPRSERVPAAPVSHYGKSKLAGEQAVAAFADRVPISIVRPPIVLGPGDRDGFEMFKGIAAWGWHVVPGARGNQFSVIDVDDLCRVLIEVAERGARVRPSDASWPGVYFAADPQLPTYGELGHMIGTALGKPRVRILQTPAPLVWTAALAAEGLARVRRQPYILSLDKAREANAGSWSCDASRLRTELGFEFAGSLQDKLNRTAAWYVEQGWLKAGRG